VEGAATNNGGITAGSGGGGAVNRPDGRNGGCGARMVGLKFNRLGGSPTDSNTVHNLHTFHTLHSLFFYKKINNDKGN
jgi:hypothetical protein